MQSQNEMPGGTNLLFGGLFIMAGELCFATMGVGVRILSGTLPNESIVFFRSFFGLCLLIPWLITAHRVGLKTRVPHLHLLRGVSGVSAMYCFFYAIANLPLAEAMLLKLTAPIFIPLVALVWLGEAVPRRVWVAILIGFAGVLLIFDPVFAGISPVALIAVLGGLLAALAKVTVRRLSRTESMFPIVFYFALIASCVSAVPLIGVWQTPTVFESAWLIAVAGLATLGQAFLTKGLALAPAARMGAFAYFSAVYGAGWGWLLWGETVAWAAIAGSVLILVSGLLAGTRLDRSSRSPNVHSAPRATPGA